jgi:hypothetical protein
MPGFLARPRDTSGSARTSAPQEETRAERELVFIPYHHWAERGPSTMRVFVPLAGTDAPTPPATAH